MVDIDGVISLFGMPAERSVASAWKPHAAGPEANEGSLHTIDGIPHYLSHAAADHLLALGDEFDLVWASGWEEKAEEYLPHLLGLPTGLPFLRFARTPGRGSAHWKLAAIDEHAGSRPLAWIDDAFDDACRSWAEDRPAATLLVQTQPERGLTSHEAALLSRWACSL
jgi:hypothetical protein